MRYRCIITKIQSDRLNKTGKSLLGLIKEKKKKKEREQEKA